MHPLSVFRNESRRLSWQKTTIYLIALVVILSPLFGIVVNKANKLSSYNYLNHLALGYPAETRESNLEDYAHKLEMETCRNWPDEDSRQECANMVDDGIIPADFSAQWDLWKVIPSIQQDVRNIKSYEDYLEDVQRQSAKMTVVARLSASRNYNMANIEKTAADYLRLDGIKPVFDINTGILLFHRSVSCLGWLLSIGALLLGIILYTSEHTSLVLYRTMKKGRLPLAITKFILLILLTVFMVLMSAGMILLLSGLLYGFGDLRRPIQSVFYTCPYRISVIQYLGAQTLLLLLVQVRTACLVAVACMLFKRVASATVSLMLLVTIGAGLRFSLSSFSPFGFLKYSSLFSGLIGDLTLSEYRNINCFGTPVSMLNVYVILSLGIIILCSLSVILQSFHGPISVIIHCSRCSLKKVKTSVPAGTLKSQQIWRHLIGQRVIIVLVSAILLSVLCVVLFPNHMSMYEAQVRSAIEKSNQQANPGEWLEQRLGDAYAAENHALASAIEEAQTIYYYTEQNSQYNAKFLSPYGYEHLVNSTFLSNNFLIIVFAVIILNLLTVRENIDNLLDIMPEALRGKRYSYVCKIIVILVIFLVSAGSEIIQIEQGYSLPFPFASASSVQLLAQFHMFSLAGIIVLLQIVRLLAVFILSFILTRLGKHGQILQLTLALALVIFPLLILKFNLLSLIQ